jgi:hypothetical protein
MSGTTAPIGTTDANPFLLPNDWVLSFPDQALTAAGIVEPLPSGDKLAVTSSAPLALAAEIGPDGVSTVLWALVDGSVAPTTVYTITLTDAAGLNPSVLFFMIVPDHTPVSLLEDLPGATHTLQAIPPKG